MTDHENLTKFDEAGRRKRKEEKPGRWFRKEKRGTNIREGVIIVPPTPESSLAKALKKVCDEELRGSKISLSVQERGGKQLGQLLGTSVPGASSKKNCGRQMCFPCNTGQEGICRKTGVGYKITCNLCEETVNMPAKLERTAFQEVNFTLLMSKGKLLTSLCGNTFWINMVEEWK